MDFCTAPVQEGISQWLCSATVPRGRRRKWVATDRNPPARVCAALESCASCHSKLEMSLLEGEELGLEGAGTIKAAEGGFQGGLHEEGKGGCEGREGS